MENSRREAINWAVKFTAELTTKDGGTTADIYAGAERLGLRKVSDDDILELVEYLRSRLEIRKRVSIGWGQIPDGIGNNIILFAVKDEDGCVLFPLYVAVSNCWQGEALWLFRQ